ncbi:Transcriptional regulator, ArsR family [Pseudorhizobium banfieldiae]|uniref:Transcriptional regulator, ArsR family n=2 Tax=Pseudorhizobium banfieldiae TaxID=1125847 RepID=L0NIP5_9HYPH|nr:ArsR family transcriptional regulator [arsenite-oxidising bacterium NT-25]CCF20137.1 Transcriptional regulator, ArsR family [Pseudorhizobium banfieldiae]
MTVTLATRIFNHMVELLDTRIDSVFHALSDATRRSMLRELSSGARSVGQLAEPHDMSLAAASKHIKVLEGAGLIRREINGRTHICRLEPGPLATAHEWLAFYERFWSDRLDILEGLLRTQDANASKAPAPPTSAAPSTEETETGEEQ